MLNFAGPINNNKLFRLFSTFIIINTSRDHVGHAYTLPEYIITKTIIQGGTGANLKSETEREGGRLRRSGL